MIWQSHWRQSNRKSGRSLIRAKNSDFPGKKFRWPFLFDHHKICRFPPKITKLPFTATFWVSCSVFLENRSHFQTDVLCKIAYNNISRPVHDPPRYPCDLQDLQSKIWGRDPPAPRIEAYGQAVRLPPASSWKVKNSTCIRHSMTVRRYATPSTFSWIPPSWRITRLPHFRCLNTPTSSSSS